MFVCASIIVRLHFNHYMDNVLSSTKKILRHRSKEDLGNIEVYVRIEAETFFRHIRQPEPRITMQNNTPWKLLSTWRLWYRKMFNRRWTRFPWYRSLMLDIKRKPFSAYYIQREPSITMKLYTPWESLPIRNILWYRQLLNRTCWARGMIEYIAKVANVIRAGRSVFKSTNITYTITLARRSRNLVLPLGSYRQGLEWVMMSNEYPRRLPTYYNLSNKAWASITRLGLNITEIALWSAVGREKLRRYVRQKLRT